MFNKSYKVYKLHIYIISINVIDQILKLNINTKNFENGFY